MKQCDKGHFFDDNRFDSCPYCKEGSGLGKQAPVSFQNQQISQYQPAPAPAPRQPQQFKFCTKCGNRAEYSARFCTGCGSAFPAVAPAPGPASDIGKTVAVSMPAAPTSDIGKTVAVRPMSPAPTSDIGKTVAVKPMTPAPSPTSDIGKTVALKPMTTQMPAPVVEPVPTPVIAPVAAPAVESVPTPAIEPVSEPAVEPVHMPAAAPVTAPSPAPASDIGKTVTVKLPDPEPAKEQNKTKPTAVLVCISGANCGDLYAVYEGRNYIASGAEADVKLDKDTSVSAECHAVITYNPSNNQFTLSAGTGRGITYLNGNQVDVSAEIKADDRIKVGSSELLFIPVCSDKFKWDAQA